MFVLSFKYPHSDWWYIDVMKNTTLRDYCNKHGQQKAAETLGCTQGAVSKMMASERRIFYELADDGETPKFYELKRLGKSPS